MKVIIAGSRTLGPANYHTLLDAIKRSGFEITEVVSGGARGCDKLGERYAEENDIPLKIFEAEWGKHGKAAGYKRNIEMADYADALIALRAGESPGTTHMIETAKRRGLKVWWANTMTVKEGRKNNE